MTEVTRTYLQMTDPAQHHHAGDTSEPVRVESLPFCPASFYRYLYVEVGKPYHWVDRLSWTDQQFRAHLDRPTVNLWVLYHAGAPAGYFELVQHEDDSTEIAYFGLMQEFLGKGLGKFLLSHAIDRAWETKPNRVWLHTCTLDDPAAMPNYVKRGLQPFKRETYFVTKEHSATAGT